MDRRLAEECERLREALTLAEESRYRAWEEANRYADDISALTPKEVDRG